MTSRRGVSRSSQRFGELSMMKRRNGDGGNRTHENCLPKKHSVLAGWFAGVVAAVALALPVAADARCHTHRCWKRVHEHTRLERKYLHLYWKVVRAHGRQAPGRNIVTRGYRTARGHVRVASNGEIGRSNRTFKRWLAPPPPPIRPSDRVPHGQAPAYAGGRWAIPASIVMCESLEGDCLSVLATLDAGSVQTCITSPPYYGLRDYGHDGQIGLGADARAVRRVARSGLPRSAAGAARRRDALAEPGGFVRRQGRRAGPTLHVVHGPATDRHGNEPPSVDDPPPDDGGSSPKTSSASRGWSPSPSALTAGISAPTSSGPSRTRCPSRSRTGRPRRMSTCSCCRSRRGTTTTLTRSVKREGRQRATATRHHGRA
jgi:hypothetical protein